MKELFEYYRDKLNVLSTSTTEKDALRLTENQVRSNLVEYKNSITTYLKKKAVFEFCVTRLSSLDKTKIVDGQLREIETQARANINFEEYFEGDKRNFIANLARTVTAKDSCKAVSILRKREVFEFCAKKLVQLENTKIGETQLRQIETQARTNFKDYFQGYNENFLDYLGKIKESLERYKDHFIAYLEKIATAKDAGIVYESEGTDLFNNVQRHLRSIYTQLCDTGTLYPLALKMFELAAEMENKNVVYLSSLNSEKAMATVAEKTEEVEKAKADKESSEQRLQALQGEVQLKTDESKELVAIMQSMLSNIPANNRGQYAARLSKFTVEKGNQGTKSTAEMVNIPFHSKPVSKFSSNLCPVPDNLKMQDPYLNGVQCASFALSERRAALVIELLRYYTKLMGWQINNEDSHRKDQYTEEKAKLDKANVNIKEYINCCIFYIFMESRKDWKALWEAKANPAKNLIELARELKLEILNEKITKITQGGVPARKTAQQVVPAAAQAAKVKTKINILDLPDTPYKGEGETKSEFHNAGKHGLMFFEFTSALKTDRFNRYCGSYRERKNHDEDQLQALYQVSR